MFHANSFPEASSTQAFEGLITSKYAQAGRGALLQVNFAQKEFYRGTQTEAGSIQFGSPLLLWRAR